MKDYLLLDFNERTSPASPKVKEALKKFVDSDRLHVYPEYGDLEQRVAEYARVKNSQVMMTNGGDQGIDIVCRATLDEGDKVIVPFPAFAMHYQSARIQGAEILESRYKEPGLFPLQEVLEMLEDEKVKLLIICNPNNPTGIIINAKDVETLVRKSLKRNVSVLVDEAYFEFSRITNKDLINKYDNLFIIRTFAKAFGIVSARAGYVISQEKNIQELLKIRGPYDINMFAKTAVLAALSDKKHMEDYVKEVMEKSKPMLEQFLKEKNIEFLPSKANFLLLKLAQPEKIMLELKKRKILTRPKEWLDGEPALRISIGALKDTKRFLRNFNEILRSIDII